MALFEREAQARFEAKFSGLSSPKMRKGLKVAYSGAVGRRLVAKWAFKFGEVVLREAPSLEWATGATNGESARAFLAACAAADEATMARVRTVFHRPVEGDGVSERCEMRRNQASALVADFAALGSADEVAALLLRLDANAHAREAAGASS